MNKIKFLSGMFAAAMLTACGESEVSVDYKLSAPVTLEMYRTYPKLQPRQ